MNDWKSYIDSDPLVLLGKPIVKGTRISVEFVLGLLSEGWSEQKILENYPTLTSDSLKAIYSFAAECMRDESFIPLRKKGG